MIHKVCKSIIVLHLALVVFVLTDNLGVSFKAESTHKNQAGEARTLSISCKLFLCQMSTYSPVEDNMYRLKTINVKVFNRFYMYAYSKTNFVNTTKPSPHQKDYIMTPFFLFGGESLQVVALDTADGTLYFLADFGQPVAMGSAYSGSLSLFHRAYQF